MSNKTCSLAEVLTKASEDDFEADDRLKLAHRLSKTVLQFHSTPWLDDEWYIENFHLFGAPSHASDAAFQLLHLDAQFPNCRERSTPLSAEGVAKPSIADKKFGSFSLSILDLCHGIRNMTLFSLGVALLEIGQWAPLQFTKLDDPLLAVRTMARGPMQLGSKYREIVRMCLECDFGYGNDLSKTDLQGAVYGSVVCQLEDMVKRLSV